MAPTLITAFDVPPDSVHPTATLHRGLRDDVAFRFVEVGPGDSSGYEVLREVGTPDVEGGVVLIEFFEVPGDDDERFVAAWDGARDVVARQRGYLGARLHRSVGSTRFRFVEIARWSSPLMYARALKEPDFRAGMPFASHAALYLVVR